MYPKKIDNYAFDCEALLVAGNGLVGFAQYYSGKFNAYQRTYVLSEFKCINPKYLRYYVSNLLSIAVEQDSVGSVITFIKLGDLQNFYVVMPNEDDQQKIADFLEKKVSEIDSAIEKTKECIEGYKKFKQAVITQAVTQGVRKNRITKPCEIEWLDCIPVEWEECRIKNLIRPREKVVTDDDEIITCFRDGEVTLRRNRREDGFTVSFTENGYHGVDVGDLVIHGMDAFAGAIGCSDSRGKTTPVVHVCDTVGNNRYFMYYLRSLAYGNILMDLSNGVRIRSSDYRNFAKLGVFGALLPPREEQDEIVGYLDRKCEEIDRLITQKEQFLTELENYKKSLIYEYVTGKKEVPQS
jgi:type I restriction enzyme S subunit